MTNPSTKYILLILFFYSVLLSQEKRIDSLCYYNEAMLALEKNNMDLAEDLFEKSVDNFNDAESYYELAKINLVKGSYVERAKALRLFKKAVYRDPGNIKYRMEYAGLLEDFAKFSAINQYEKIIELDSAHTQAWFKLAKIKQKDFTEYYNSFRMLGDDFLAPMNEYALEDFEEAEHFYLKALESDPANEEITLRLALLYENKDSLTASIFYLEKLVENNSASKEGHLYLGLCFAFQQKYKEAHSEYAKALTLMNYEEKKDFTLNSVIELIEPVFEGISEAKESWYVNNVINAYWKLSDPLYENGVNERLLEHYTRVAYANLHFSVPDMKIVGWKTDRGLAVLRYGIPEKKMRLRPYMSDAGIVVMKTEVWNYDDMAFGFTDQFSSGNYVHSAPMGEKSHSVSQFAGDSHTYAQQLKNIRHQYYKPPFYGPRFDIDYELVQMKDKNKDYTDVYLIYSYTLEDSSFQKTDSLANHRWAVNFFDPLFNEIISREDEVVLNNLPVEVKRVNNLRIVQNTIPLKMLADSGLISLRVMRLVDKGYSSLVKQQRINNFSSNEFAVSDIIFADGLFLQSKNGSIRRNDISFNPLSQKWISSAGNPYLYYEIYNLTKGSDNLTDYSIQVKIYKQQSGDLVSSVVTLFKNAFSVLGLNEDDSITLTSNYKTVEHNPQMYLQMDFSSLEKGDYKMEIKVIDNLSNEAILSAKDFILN